MFAILHIGLFQLSCQILAQQSVGNRLLEYSFHRIYSEADYSDRLHLHSSSVKAEQEMKKSHV